MLKTRFLNNDLNQFKLNPFLLILFFLISPLFLLAETKLIILGSGTPNPDPERYALDML